MLSISFKLLANSVSHCTDQQVPPLVVQKLVAKQRKWGRLHLIGWSEPLERSIRNYHKATHLTSLTILTGLVWVCYGLLGWFAQACSSHLRSSKIINSVLGSQLNPPRKPRQGSWASPHGAAMPPKWQRSTISHRTCGQWYQQIRQYLRSPLQKRWTERRTQRSERGRFAEQ